MLIKSIARDKMSQTQVLAHKANGKAQLEWMIKFHVPVTKRVHIPKEEQTNKIVYSDGFGGHGGLVIRSRPRDRRVAGPKPDSTEDPPCMGPVARSIIPSGQTPSRGVA
ncbi:hypothetical protein AVEN_176519-1 [Araneus ventricosus]|uniref:Uncharacterized protein n=1 Tax=Araneus ventricosus TaxID=182803 RepID=A0A4Y2U3Q1_ARAVE|nr:hypothetical protein AVEN_176519-1 [Araneus ventricosus]